MQHIAEVAFYFTPSSRYSYLASTQLAGISARTGCRFIWKPLNNFAILERFGADPFNAAQPSSGQYSWAYREQDARAWASYYGVPFVEPVNFRVDPDWLERGCFAAEACGHLIAFGHALFKAIFVDARVLSEGDLPGLATDIGIPRDAFKEAYTSEVITERQEAVLNEAAAKGVFGVPTFLFDDHFFWGNDRLVLLEHALVQRNG